MPIRWVLVQDVAGAFEPQAFVGTNEAADPLDRLRLFVRRWPVEVTFAAVRRPRGAATQRQWSDLAIARTTPALLALFSLVTLWTSSWFERGLVLPRCAAWSATPESTCSDALAAVRRELWTTQAFSPSPRHRAIIRLPRTLLDSLTQAACSPAPNGESQA